MIDHHFPIRTSIWVPLISGQSHQVQTTGAQPQWAEAETRRDHWGIFLFFSTWKWIFLMGFLMILMEFHGILTDFSWNFMAFWRRIFRWDFELPSFFDGAYHHGLEKQAWHVRAARWVVPWRSKGLVECGGYDVDPTTICYLLDPVRVVVSTYFDIC